MRLVKKLNVIIVSSHPRSFAFVGYLSPGSILFVTNFLLSEKILLLLVGKISLVSASPGPFSCLRFGPRERVESVLWVPPSSQAPLFRLWSQIHYELVSPAGHCFTYDAEDVPSFGLVVEFFLPHVTVERLTGDKGDHRRSSVAIHC